MTHRVLTLVVTFALIGRAPLVAWQEGSSSPQRGSKDTIAEIRVHGNASLADQDVIRLAGVSIGASLEPDGLEAIEGRLRESGKFDEIQVRKRYRTLSMDQVALVLLVHERPGVRPDGTVPSPVHRFASRLMFLPILTYEDGYGWSYGGRTSIVGGLGAGERLSLPLTWGAERRAALEAERTFRSGPVTRLQGSFGIAQRENPHFDVTDRRVELRARAERRLFGGVTLGTDIGQTNVNFAGAPDHFWTNGADVALDTRRDPNFPSDAVLLGAGWNRLRVAGSAINRYRLEGRGYKRIIGQTVLAVRAQYDMADAPLPLYEQWLLGGSSLRGTRAGTFAGDKRLIGSAELRVPLSSPLHTARMGVTTFIDAGVDAPYTRSLRDAPAQRGVGGGVFLVARFIGLNLDIAHSLDGYGTRVHFRTGFSF